MDKTELDTLLNKLRILIAAMDGTELTYIHYINAIESIETELKGMG